MITSHGITQISPKAAISIKVIFHPNAIYNKAMIGADITEPKEAPAPKIPCAIALSFAGNHSALLFVAPGQLPASEKPSRNLKILKDIRPRAKA
ncbi:hypothetical protein D3C80_1676660 [compost metagenome]